jgi:hypothetical protein
MLAPVDRETRVPQMCGLCLEEERGMPAHFSKWKLLLLLSKLQSSLHESKLHSQPVGFAGA